MSSKVKIISGAVGIFIVGIIFGLIFNKTTQNNVDVRTECSQLGFQYTNCDIAHTESRVIKKHEYTALKSRIEQYIFSHNNIGNVDKVSVYFRDLKFGPTMGINENEKFIPASLLKVPVLLTYLRYAESDPRILQNSLSFSDDGKVQTLQEYVPSQTLRPNTPYTIDEMLRFMIVYSDNRAYEGLVDYLRKISPNKDLLKDTIIDLGIINPDSYDNEIITVKSYASLFRLLYNVSFLETEEMSAKALKYLVETEFSSGIVAGLPEDIKVAHKFGERGGLPNNKKQLHDCGIVYYPNNPYILCVMSRGNDYKNLAQTIATISEMVYEEVESRRIK